MVEVLVSLSIIVVSILAAMSVTEKSMAVSRQALHTAQSSFLLDEGAEAVRILRDGSWNNISNLSVGTPYYLVFANGNWSLSATPSTVGNFTRTIIMSSVNRDANSSDIVVSGVNDPLTRLVTVNVSWNESGQIKNKTLPFYIMDIFS